MRGASRLKSYFFACLTGCLLWIGCAFEGAAWPVLLVSLLPLLLVIRRASIRRTLFCGLLAGLVHYTFLLYWILIVLGRYGEFPWYLSVPVLLLLVLYMSAFIVVFALFARVLFRCAPPIIVLWTLPCLWVGLDWTRTFLFSGFPWMDIGYALWKFPALLQSADLAGHYGMTFLLVLVNALLFLSVDGGLGRKKRYALALPVLALVATAVVYSAVRWRQVEDLLVRSPVARVGAVQGNIDQRQEVAAGGTAADGEELSWPDGLSSPGITDGHGCLAGDGSSLLSLAKPFDDPSAILSAGEGTSPSDGLPLVRNGRPP